MEQHVADRALRPLRLQDFGGQPHISQQLEIFLKAAKDRGEVLEHLLLFGPPGLGKTTLANIIANEMGGAFQTTSGPLLQKPGDLIPILVSLDANSVLFIDEIHRMSIQAEEILYSAMEDGYVDILLEEGETKSIRVTLEPFTLIGATTRAGMLSAPLRDRFGITFRLEYYRPEALSLVISNAAEKLSLVLPSNCALTIAKRSRGTPRIALRLLRRVRDVIEGKEQDFSSLENIDGALTFLGVSPTGLDEQDLSYLKLLAKQFSGGPVGIKTMATAMGEDSGTIEDTIEPYLIQEGFLQRTSRGRVITDIGRKQVCELF